MGYRYYIDMSKVKQFIESEFNYAPVRSAVIVLCALIAVLFTLGHLTTI